LVWVWSARWRHPHREVQHRRQLPDHTLRPDLIQNPDPIRTIGKRKGLVDVLGLSLVAAPTGKHPAPTDTAHIAHQIQMRRIHPLATSTSAKSHVPQLIPR